MYNLSYNFHLMSTHLIHNYYFIYFCYIEFIYFLINTFINVILIQRLNWKFIFSWFLHLFLLYLHLNLKIKINKIFFSYFFCQNLLKSKIVKIILIFHLIFHFLLLIFLFIIFIHFDFFLIQLVYLINLRFLDFNEYFILIFVDFVSLFLHIVKWDFDTFLELKLIVIRVDLFN